MQLKKKMLVYAELTLPNDNECCKTNYCIKSWLTYRAVLSFIRFHYSDVVRK